MKKITICLLIVLSASQFSCKKFLDITPIDKLTGNNFYRSADDMESNITDMYGRLFDKYTRTSFAGATGEFRSGEAIPAVQGGELRRGLGRLGGHTRQTPDPRGNTDKQVIPETTIDDRLLLEAVQTGRSWSDYNFGDLTVWNEYYQVIQAANLLISKIEEGIPALTAEQSKRYIAEGKFIRSFCYFQMVRLYGDVVYYTTAYQKDPLPRENMVSVVNKCIADLKTAKPDIIWTMNDPSLRGVRASRGAIVGLLMNLNMWNAGFDPANKTKYYEETAALGDELIKSNAFRLLPITEWATVAKGRSEESLFELFRTLNYNDSDNPFAQANPFSPFADVFIHFPYKQPEYTHRYSNAVFTELYMKKLYPDEGDGRLNYWFVSPFDQNAETFQLKKFAYNTFVDASNPGLDINPDNTYLIMRYADAILLRAEALAELGTQDEEAIKMLNLVRDRGRATLYPNAVGDTDLKDAIFWERAKELMGEGTHYFDLVRTKKVLNKTYTDNPLTYDKFNRGGWTWPINPSALNNNPYMSLNEYWIGTGL
ncbi:RagB/SusD family nutrient uptake outer membrane protein [Pedobacter frigoris]|uniref:RagB/SusD family nutrient uptake outer membrane protein n=1 Tax=Pedobacter frigoris TaxID=2571272 RepID=A0A4U1CMS2_9SPHI|nr:RagB/SusD family nutrient uptake outer membrane protein [Pedobacter frigoris]TKC09181.1 RagB/SusD family nutrient uptake outer membrane protein [Pedobacter frigoris]